MVWYRCVRKERKERKGVVEIQKQRERETGREREETEREENEEKRTDERRGEVRKGVERRGVEEREI
jgi:hypothetical protein